MCLQILIPVAAFAYSQKRKREREAAEQAVTEAETIEAEVPVTTPAPAPQTFSSELAPGLSFTSQSELDNYIFELGAQSTEPEEVEPEINTSQTPTAPVIVGYDEQGNPIYASDLQTNINTLQDQVETLEETNINLSEEVERLGQGDPEQVVSNLQNITYTTVVQDIEKQQEDIKTKKAEQLRKTLRQRRRIGTKGRASLITGISGGIGYQSGLTNQQTRTPPNIKLMN
tara:strand:+ start:10687 stop:11373 length:687 start_codon:yes stop_codon:yes gene_type:complete